EYVPGAAAEVVVIVSVEPLPEVTDVGLSDAVTPAGAPETDSTTLSGGPDVTAVAIVEVVELPAAIAAPAAPAEIEQAVNVRAVMCEMHPFCDFDQMFWIVYVTPSPPTNVPWLALQMSAVSP